MSWKSSRSGDEFGLISIPRLVPLMAGLIFHLFSLGAQRPAYFINVALDTTRHTLTGTLEIMYTNQSEVPIEKIGIHLWANAYAKKNNAFDLQLLDQGKVEYHFAPKRDMGGYTALEFTSHDVPFFFSYDSLNEEIGWLVLDRPLAAGQHMTIYGSFELTIPVSFSRIGRTGDSYQLTQWYPHIAVHDQEGWHTMPYLDQGEYFNDFADYDVRIKVPTGYILAATGSLEEKMAESGMTTWKFKAENVIDFAWFANPHFQVIEKELNLGANRSVLLSVYVDTLSPVSWTQVPVYAERALRFYGDWLGEYPYPDMRVVSAPWSKGGYMEYPMVAQIGLTSGEAFLDIVVAHEIGHTWLYGILANDERSDAWMDEGLNTFFERKYAQQYYPGYVETSFPEEFRSASSMPEYDVLQHSLRFSHELQPPATNLQDQSGNQYLFSAYLLPAEALEMMESRLGTAKIREMFNHYFQENKFTHVRPVDLRVAFEKSCDCSLSWFFNTWLRKADQLDYRIKSFKPRLKEVTLVNKGTPDLPVQLSSFRNGEELTSDWLAGFRGVKTIHFDQRADKVTLFHAAPAVNKRWWRNSFPRALLPEIHLIPKVSSYEKSQMSITPFFAYNVTDGILPGPVIMSDILPQRAFKWILAPSFGLESHKFRGYGEGRYIADISKGIFDKLLLSFSVNLFGYHLDTTYGYSEHYFRLSPTLALRHAFDSDHKHLTQWWKYRYVNVEQYFAQGISAEDKIFLKKHRQYGIHELSYAIRSDVALLPYTASGNAQLGRGFVRLNFKFKQHIAGKSPQAGTWVRAFAGYKPVNKNSKINTDFTLSGGSSSGYASSDYMYDQWLGGRNEDTGTFGHQLFMKDAELKTLASHGVSTTWMLAAGASQAMPFHFIHVYMDAAWYESALEHKPQFSYSGGIALIGWKDGLEIYFPILESRDIRNSLTYAIRHRWVDRISFQLNFRLISPLDVVDHLTLGY